MEFGAVLATLVVLGFLLVLWNASRNVEPVRGMPEAFVAARWWADKVTAANNALAPDARLTPEQIEPFEQSLVHRIAEYHDDNRAYPVITFSSLDGKLHPVLEKARKSALVYQRGFLHPDGPSLPKVLPLPLPEGIFEMSITQDAVNIRQRKVVLDARALKHFGFVREDASVRQPEFESTTLKVEPFPVVTAH